MQIGLRGKPLWRYSFDTYHSHPEVDAVGIVCAEGSEWLYDLPVLTGYNRIARQALGSWQLSGIVIASTGTPIYVAQSGSARQINRPDYIGGVAVNPDWRQTRVYLNKAGFAQVPSGSVSRATVYRTLPLLTESGLVREMDFGKDYKFSDPYYAEHPHHSHIICGDCSRIVEFESEKIEKLENEITQKLGFSVKTQRLHITGACEQMKRLGSCKNKRC